jgi:hypothetical protein
MRCVPVVRPFLKLPMNLALMDALQQPIDRLDQERLRWTSIPT